MGTSETFQVPIEAAEVYEAEFVPALFGEWASYLVDAASVTPGQRVLDVACGTGVVAREAADRTRDHGHVVGLDLNENMLAVARRLRPDVEWRQGDAASLPFPDGSFDAVLCQASLMYFPDPLLALREMRRVAVAGGTVAIQVWDRLESQPGYGPFVEVAVRHAGPEAAALMETYWKLGDLDRLTGLVESAGLRVTRTTTRLGAVRFPSIDEFVRTEIEGTPLVERLPAEAFERILEDSREALASFRTETGGAEVPISGHLVAATKDPS